MKTKFMKAVTLCLALIMCFSSVLSVSAAEVADATINHENDCSLTIFKYDWTNAVKDGVWNNESFTSTGWQESYVESVLGGSNGSTLGNSQTAYGYALKGVEFTLLRVADIVTFTESTNDDHPEYNMTQVLYGFDKTASADLLKAIGLENGANRYENADATDKLDSKEIVIGENVNTIGDERYMCAYCDRNEIFGLYSDLWVSDDFCEIAKIYADRLSEQAEKTRRALFTPKFQGIDTTPLTKADCTPISSDDRRLYGNKI